MSAAELPALVCSFCGKTADQVHNLVAGPGDVRICNECVGLCVEIVVDHHDTDHGLALLTTLTGATDVLVEALRDAGVPWADIQRALRPDT